MTGPSDDDLHEVELFREFAATKSRRVRNQLVEQYIGLAVHIAKRFARPGMGDDDVRQVAMLGLVKAVDRFDPDYGAAFSSFAGRTIEGEVKRHFRDTSWAVRVPRGDKDLFLLVRRATDELSHEVGRSPTVDEVTAHLGVDRDDVLRGLSASAAYRVGSIDGDADDDQAPTDRVAVLATDDDGFESTVDREVVGGLLGLLPEREREIVRLRFYEEMSQSEIAEIVGMSQMHVSRLLRRSFEQMRAQLGTS